MQAILAHLGRSLSTELPDERAGEDGTAGGPHFLGLNASVESGRGRRG